MWSISRKDFSQFFSSLTGYIAIIIFLVVTGLFLFVLPDSNLLDYGYASLDKFFDLAPWILVLMVPALSMRLLADEFRSGTFELLKTGPVTAGHITLGKYLALMGIVLLVIIPTFIYIWTIKHLSADGGIDGGSIAGSYAGLFLLAAVFAAISLACGSFTSNAIVAFLISVFACTVLYYGFNALSRLPVFSGGADYIIEQLGIDFHYRNMSRGVIDSRDVIYCLSLIFFCLFITRKNIQAR